MFDSKTKLTHRLTDAADLLIDFATLGEYGLEEPVGRTRQGCVDLPAASTRRRPTAPSTRASARSASCNLAEESGLFRQHRVRPGQPV
jgi:hypothetical protein